MNLFAAACAVLAVALGSGAAGASGFVGKSLPILHILHALDRVVRGGEWFNHNAEPVEPRAGPTARVVAARCRLSM